MPRSPQRSLAGSAPEAQPAALADWSVAPSPGTSSTWGDSFSRSALMAFTTIFARIRTSAGSGGGPFAFTSLTYQLLRIHAERLGELAYRRELSRRLARL